MSTVTVRIEDTYEDGHSAIHEHEVEAPEDDDLEDWWDEEVFEHTGDGHGAKHPKLGSLHEARIIRADDPTLVGKEMEW